MAAARPARLDRPVDATHDHVLGNPDAEITLVEYGSYACPYCHAAHSVIADLRDRFGERMRYVFRHRPVPGNDDALHAAELAEYAFATSGHFWQAHDALMKRGPIFGPDDFAQIAAELELPTPDAAHMAAADAARQRVREDTESALRSGVRTTPAFFINGRRYEGAWDAGALSEAMLGSLGHRLHAATLDFMRWTPGTGLVLLVMTLSALVLMNSSFGPAFQSFWHTQIGARVGGRSFTLPLLDWINDGLLTIFFLVVGLEIKREFTVGRLATRRAATLPVIAAFGGMVVPALIYLALVPSGPLSVGWGLTIATDTAFAIAIIMFLGDRVPVELRVFLMAAVILDDLVAIILVALFYSNGIDVNYLAAAAAVVIALIALNRLGVYGPLPYALLGLLLWIFLHDAGLHATLAGVIMALVTPTRPPGNLHALMAQAEMVMRAETASAGERVMRHGLSGPAMRAIDTIHDRIESPADKLLRTVEPWSNYVVLPIFALANAGVAWAPGVVAGRGGLILAIVLGLVIGKPLGIVTASWLAVRAGIAVKPPEYSWRQLAGAGALAGIGFTMSLFIAGRAFAAEDFAAAKVAIFIASLTAAALGIAILWPRSREADNADAPASPDGSARRDHT